MLENPMGNDVVDFPSVHYQHILHIQGEAFQLGPECAVEKGWWKETGLPPLSPSSQQKDPEEDSPRYSA